MSDAPGADTWLDAVRQVLVAVRRTDITELEIGTDAFAVRIRREPSEAITVLAGVPAGTDADDDSRYHRVLAPFTGVFYRSPTPSAGAYVDDGDWVDADAVIGLIETMKIFNEIKVDLAGKIVRFAAENGQLVQTGDPLALLEPGERATAEPEAAL